MAKLDGSIRIGVVFDDKKIASEMNKLDQKLAKQNQGIKDQQNKVKQLEDQYARLASREVEPKSLKRMETDLKKVQAEAAKLDEEFQRLNQVASIERQAGGKVSPETQGQIDDVTEKLAYADQRADALQKKIQEIRLDPAASEEAMKLAGQLESARGKLEQLQRDAAATGQAKAELEAEANSMQEVASNAQVADQRIVDLNRELAELTARMKELKGAGVGLGYEDFDQASARVKEINAELKEYQKNLASAPAPDASKWERISSTLKSGFSRTVQAASSATKGLGDRVKALGRNKGFDKAGKAAGRFASRLKSLVAGALFFNVISRGLSALSKQIGKYLTANREFSTALGSIKSNLLTAFQPIYDKIIPALNALMAALQRATAQAAVFIARIFGTTADKAQKDAEALKDKADAIEETGEAAKKAEKEQKKYLASFDTIEKLGEKEEKTEEDAKPTEPGFDTDFSEIEPPKWLLDFWAPIQESWDQVGGATVEAVKSALGSIWDLLKAIGQTFLDMWNSAIGVETLNNLQLLLQTILGIIHDIAAAFMTAWNSGTGEEVIAALFYMINSILELLISVGQAFRDAWNDNGRGVEICNTILQIIRNIFEIVGNLANRFREAWEANENGKRIFGAILDIIKIVLQTFERITKATADWAAELDLEPLMNSIRNLFEQLVPVVQQIGDILAWIWEQIVLPFMTFLLETALPIVVDLLGSVLDALNEYPSILQGLTILVGLFFAAWTFGKIINGIKLLVNNFDPLILVLATLCMLLAEVAGAWDNMNGLERFIAVLGLLVTAAAVAAIAVGALQSALTMGIAAIAIAAGITAVVAAVNSATNRANSAKNAISAGGGGRSYSPRMAAYAGEISAYSLNDLPHLAQGAVISPNSEFLAVLGDQRSGTNVEAPLATIEQALENVFARHGGTGGGGTQVTVNFTGSLAQLARILQPEIKVEQARLGPSLV